jgi:hypothetical protein
MNILRQYAEYLIAYHNKKGFDARDSKAMVIFCFAFGIYLIILSLYLIAHYRLYTMPYFYLYLFCIVVFAAFIKFIYILVAGLRKKSGDATVIQSSIFALGFLAIYVIPFKSGSTMFWVYSSFFIFWESLFLYFKYRFIRAKIEDGAIVFKKNWWEA